MSASTYYPPPSFYFSVAVASGTYSFPPSGIDAAFQEITGIDPKVQVEEVVEGGLNSHVHQLPGVTKHGNLVLKRGYVTRASTLADWAFQTVGSTLGTPIVTQTLNVYLLDPAGQPQVTWTFMDAWPLKWEIGALDSSKGNTVLMQTLEVSYSTVSTQQNSSSNY